MLEMKRKTRNILASTVRESLRLGAKGKYSLRDGLLMTPVYSPTPLPMLGVEPMALAMLGQLCVILLQQGLSV